VTALVASWDARVQERFEVPAGRVEAPLRREEPGQSSMGAWAADLVRQAAEADVGLYNRGGLRADLEAGELSLLDLYRVFPFGNEVVSFTWTGRELEDVVRRGLWGELSEDPAPLQWSGIRYQWTLRDGEPELLKIWVGGALLEADSVYSIATNVFVSWQWENILEVPPGGTVKDHGLTVFQAAERAASAGLIGVPADARSVRLASP